MKKIVFLIMCVSIQLTQAYVFSRNIASAWYRVRYERQMRLIQEQLYRVQERQYLSSRPQQNYKEYKNSGSSIAKINISYKKNLEDQLKLHQESFDLLVSRARLLGESGRFVDVQLLNTQIARRLTIINDIKKEIKNL